jgi:flagellar protein FliO/FliZ
MTWMIVRLVLSLAFVAAVLLFAARLAKKRGLGRGNDLIEVVARQRMGRTSTLNVVRVADLVLVIGATEEQITLLAEVDPDAVDHALRDRAPVRLAPAPAPALGPAEDLDEDQDEDYDAYDEYDEAPQRTARSTTSSALAGSVLDRDGWGSLVHELRERSVRRS